METEKVDYLEEARRMLDIAGEHEYEARMEGVETSRQWVETYALLSIAESLAKLSGSMHQGVIATTRLP